MEMKSDLTLKLILKLLKFILLLLNSLHCVTSCDIKGDKQLTKMQNGGSVTMRVTGAHEILDVHWIRASSHNVFFRIAECCSFEGKCCQEEKPQGCCKIENTTYETKLCSCEITKLASSITLCNVTSEDEGLFLVEIHDIHNNSSTCQYYLSLHETEKEVKPPQGPDKLYIIIIILIVAVFLMVPLIVKYLIEAIITQKSHATTATSTGENIEMDPLGSQPSEGRLTTTPDE